MQKKTKETIAPDQKLTRPPAMIKKIDLVSQFLFFYVNLQTLLFSTENPTKETLFATKSLTKVTETIKYKSVILPFF